MPSPRRRFFRPADLFLLALFCAALLAWRLHDGALLSAPVREYSDEAANGLKIDDAKRLALTTGNYSRWDFCHPGPAFFYVDAAAERLACGTFRWLPAPGNAHRIAMLLAALLFFSVPLLAVARRVGNGWFMPLALLLAAVHYGLAVGNRWESVWPPNVLIFPFFALLVAAALAATGEAAALPGLVLAGGFLLHGHVAQPLFVVPLGGAAWLLLLRARGWRWRRLLGWNLAALGLIVLFALPWAVEAAKPGLGNFGDILAHLRSHPKLHTPLDAAAYLLSFFAYRTDQDAWTFPLLPHLRAILVPCLPWLLGWAALLGLGAFLGLRTPAPRNGGADSDRPFLRRLGWTVGAALVLSFVWGIKQDGPLFAFNSFFFYSIQYALLLVAVAVPVSRWLAAAPRLARFEAPAVGAAALACAGVLAAAAWLPARHPAEPAFFMQIAETVAKDDPDRRPIHLLWTHEAWPFGAALALNLDRAGIPWTAHANYRILCDGHVEAEPETEVNTGGLIWTVVPDAASPSGFAIRTDLPTLAPGEARPAADPLLFPYLLDGFDLGLDLGLLWSERPRTLLRFVPRPAEGDVDLVFEAVPLTGTKGDLAVTRQRAALAFDGTAVGEQELQEKGTARFRIPKDLWNRAGGTRCVVVRLDFPDAVAPKALGLSRHAKPRAWGLVSFGAENAAPAK